MRKLWQGIAFELGLPWWLSGKESAYNAEDPDSIRESGRSLERGMAAHSSTLALKIPWTEELGAGYYPWGGKESGTTERLHFHFHIERSLSLSSGGGEGG